MRRRTLVATLLSYFWCGPYLQTSSDSRPVLGSAAHFKHQHMINKKRL